MNIKIRKATLKDLDLVVELFSEFMKDHDKIIAGFDKKLNQYRKRKKNAPELFKKHAEQQIRKRTGNVFLAYVNGKIAGYNLIYIKDNIPIYTEEKLGCIGDLFVKKEDRGKGISTIFKNNAFEWFKSKRIRYVSLATWPANKHAQNIYKKWGFEDVHVEMRKKL